MRHTYRSSTLIAAAHLSQQHTYRSSTNSLIVRLHYYTASRFRDYARVCESLVRCNSTEHTQHRAHAAQSTRSKIGRAHV